MESFAAGTPVIGSNLGGIPELVRHQVDGLLVEPENVQAWADALRRCGGSSFACTVAERRAANAQGVDVAKRWRGCITSISIFPSALFARNNYSNIKQNRLNESRFLNEDH
jgi:glycosyltransferase involved in cell wall biosynthesis